MSKENEIIQKDIEEKYKKYLDKLSKDDYELEKEKAWEENIKFLNKIIDSSDEFYISNKDFFKSFTTGIKEFVDFKTDLLEKFPDEDKIQEVSHLYLEKYISYANIKSNREHEEEIEKVKKFLKKDKENSLIYVERLLNINSNTDDTTKGIINEEYLNTTT